MSAFPPFVQQNWGEFLNTEPVSLFYWVALAVFVLSFVQPLQLAALSAATGLSTTQLQQYSGVVVAALYAKIQMKLF